MDLDVDESPRLQSRQAPVHALPNRGLGRRPLLDDASVQRKVEVGRVLIERVDPAVADEETFERSGEARRCEDGLRDVGDILACVGFAGEVGLRYGTLAGQHSARARRKTHVVC